jgi:hypothetical protein
VLPAISCHQFSAGQVLGVEEVEVVLSVVSTVKEVIANELLALPAASVTIIVQLE